MSNHLFKKIEKVFFIYFFILKGQTCETNTIHKYVQQERSSVHEMKITIIMNYILQNLMVMY